MIKKQLIWLPSETEKSLMQSFIEKTADLHKGSDDLQKWSVEKPEEFWSQVWDFNQVIGD